MNDTALKKEIFTFASPFDGLMIETLLIAPKENIRGIVQLSHGMAEHKERYEDFMTYLAQNGFAAIINDHRGHGKSVKSQADLGYFYTLDTQAIVADLYAVSQIAKDKYPQLPLYLFSHSMGTLVSRLYLKKYDSEIDKLILCGPPTKNDAVNLAILLTKISLKLQGAKHRSKLLNYLAFNASNKKFGQPNYWLSSDLKEVEKYEQDPLCGYIFTNNGFFNLFLLMKEAFAEQNWQVKNSQLPILLIAGADDPIIQSESKFRQLELFLKQVGYQNTNGHLYENMRHELLNEKNKHLVYQDLLDFLNENYTQKAPK